MTTADTPLPDMPIDQRDRMVAQVWTFLTERGYTITAPGAEPTPGEVEAYARGLNDGLQFVLDTTPHGVPNTSGNAGTYLNPHLYPGSGSPPVPTQPPTAGALTPEHPCPGTTTLPTWSCGQRAGHDGPCVHRRDDT